MDHAPPDRANATVTIGIDLGGTGTRLVALDADGRTDGTDVTPTYHGSDAETAVGSLVQRIRAVAAGRTIAAIGIGASGPVEQSGVIRNQATLPAYTGLPLMQRLQETFGAPCIIDNDAAAAALAEFGFGTHSGSAALLGVTLGTGVGAAYLNHGRLFKTATGAHPELGHISVTGPDAPCYCGLRTCWEQLASRTALIRQLGADPDLVAGAARAGNATAAALFDDFGGHVGAGVATLVTVFEPSHVVLGGGAAVFFDLFEAGVWRALTRQGPFTTQVVLSASTLGPEAGALGAAQLARHHL
jgi:glucokinase